VNPQDSARSVSCLLVSNGYGEDLMGAALARALRSRGVEVTAYPLVGMGQAYAAAGVRTLDPRRNLPTAGFGFRTGIRAAWEDLRAGWIPLTLAQRGTLRAQRNRHRLVVAVGDVFCLWMASAAGRTVVYVPTAKSETNDPHRWFELALVRRMSALSFPRDEVTAERFRRAGLPAEFVGNLMMDCLEFSGETFHLPQEAPVVLLLPGSRRDAGDNLARLWAAARQIAARRADVHFLLAVSPSVQPEELARACGAVLDPSWMRDEHLQVQWTRNFADAVARSWVVLGMAGTAHEQAAGLGKPVVVFPGGGVQFNRKFLQLQAKLLGEAVVPVSGPQEAARAVLRLLEDPEERRRRGQAGKHRMGPPGAALRMVDRLLAMAG